jgi:hypothetical protein
MVRQVKGESTMQALSSSQTFMRLSFGCLVLLISFQVVAVGQHQAESLDSGGNLGEATQIKSPGEKLQKLCAGIDNSFECAQVIERNQLQKPEYARMVTRQGERLNFKLRTGGSLTLENSGNADDGSATKYSFRDHLPEIGYYLVHCQYYEGSEYLMINDRSGKRFKLQQIPAVSPDRRRIATASAGLFGCCGPNAVQVWRVTSGGLVLEQTIEPKGWEPSDAEWVDNRTIRLIKNFSPDGEGNRSAAQPVLLKLHKKWALEEK